MTYIYGAQPSEIFRGIGKASPSKYSTPPETTPLADESAKKAENKDNTSGITIALNDFSKLTNSFTSSGKSCVKEANVKDNAFDKIKAFFGNKSDNVFKTDKMKEVITNGNVYTQNDIFAEDVEKNGGLQYSKKGHDIYESALNYAKADIKAVETALQNAYPGDGIRVDSKLDVGDVSSYVSDNAFLKDNFEKLDLDGKEKYISPEEYASYIVTADSDKDGIITAEESQAFQDMKADDMINSSQNIFDKHYK